MRRLLFSWWLALALSGLGASSALAEAPKGPQKTPIYSAEFGLECANNVRPPGTFGFAVLNTPGNEMKLSGDVALRHVLPNATYEVVAPQTSPLIAVCPDPIVGSITTNEVGDGNLHFTVERFPPATEFWVQVLNPVTEEQFESTPVEVD
jgi:hypothetical protein